MQPSKNTLAGAVLVLLAGGWMIWLLMMRQPNSPALPLAPPAPRQAAALPALARKPAPPPVFGSAEFKKMLVQGSASWLEARHRDAPGLLALWDISGDETYLREAAARFPDDPQICTALLDHWLTNPARMSVEEAQLQVDRLIAAAPDNPMSYYWEAYFLDQLPSSTWEPPNPGYVETLTATLQTALSKPGVPDRYLFQRRMVLKEAALAAGASPREAARLSMNGASLASMESKFINRLAFTREKTSQSPADRALTELSIQASQHLAQVPGLTVRFQQRLAQLENMSVSMLLERDPDAVIPETGQSVREYLDQRRLHPPEEEALLRQESAVTRFLGEMPDPVIAKYADLLALEGEFSALRWAVGEMARKR
ncbi:MAG: hypothetical protein V4675_09140 [Verrucomicrobiota bacterium]